MTIKFTCDAAKLNAAIDMVSIVAPKPVTPQGGAGYLFVVRGETCHVYSRDNTHAVKSEFPLKTVDGEGAFIYPSAHTSGFTYLNGDITFEVTPEGDEPSVKYSSDSGAGAERSTFDHRLVASCDKELSAAAEGKAFHVGILREAIGLGRNFLAKPTDTRVEDHFKTLQVFDAAKPEWAKGNGCMFAANGVQAFFFQCSAFEDKGFSIHGQHLPQLIAFLAKCEGNIDIRVGDQMTFAVASDGQALGWAHHVKTHSKYSYYSLDMDGYVMTVPKGPMLNALKYTRTELDAKRDKIKLQFSCRSEGDKTIGNLQFEVREGTGKAMSFPVATYVDKVEEGAPEFACNVNVDHLMDLFSACKSNQVQLRVAVIPASEKRPKQVVMFRTVDEFLVDEEGKVVGGSGAVEVPDGVFRCQVTRFMPSKE